MPQSRPRGKGGQRFASPEVPNPFFDRATPAAPAAPAPGPAPAPAPEGSGSPGAEPAAGESHRHPRGPRPQPHPRHSKGKGKAPPAPSAAPNPSDGRGGGGGARWVRRSERPAPPEGGADSAAPEESTATAPTGPTPPDTPTPAAAQRRGPHRPPKASPPPAPRRQASPVSPVPVPEGATPLCEEIIRQLEEGYECMICCETVRRRQPVWSCGGCFKLFHLPCIRKWAKGGTFRCPACQLSHPEPPTQYRCFCGKVRDPEPDPYGVPHSCSAPCGRLQPPCPHPCLLPCHPGPCPACLRPRDVACHCGRESKTVVCSQYGESFQCDAVCGHPLACGRHQCAQQCHEGPCVPCAAEVLQPCHCGKHERLQPCRPSSGADAAVRWTCLDVCGAPLACGHHTCEGRCHAGPCPPCPYLPTAVSSCPCGKTPLYALTPTPRTSCVDPVPTCKKVCGRKCQGGHACQQPCHKGPCKPCTATAPARCACGNVTVKVPCGAMATAASFIQDVDGRRHPWPLTCQRKCGATRGCGRHRCEAICCPARAAGAKDPRHACAEVCGKWLACRQHQCDEPCHKGPCSPCMHIITTDLACACGQTSLPPPLPCATPPPACDLPCAKPRPCGHNAGPHPCHFGDCPPCTVLVEKLCAGGHVLVPNVPCHLDSRLCGSACGKTLSCGSHTCQQRCHAPPCQPGVNAEERAPCPQPCGQPLPCGHGCAQRCHPLTECRPASCQQTVPLKCDCGRRVEQVPCRQYQAQLKERAGKKGVPLDQLPVLPCDADCAAEKRLRGFAEALGVRRDQQWQPETLWAPEIFETARRKRMSDVQALERLLQDFLAGPKVNYLFPNKSKAENDFIREVASYYSIDSTVLEKSVYLTKTSSSAAPAPPLSAALANPTYNPHEKVRQRLQKSPGCALVFDRLSSTMREAELREYLKGYLGKYALRWHSDTTCVALFQTAEMREDALQGLKKLKCPLAVSPFTAANHPVVYRALFEEP